MRMANVRCPKGHGCPALGHIFRTLKLRDSDVLNVYLVGSHMWGTCHSRSDWDLVIITAHTTSPKPLNTHKGNIEAFILSREQFCELVKDHSMQVLLVLWLPKECILLEQFNPRSTFSFNQESLVKSLEHSRDRDMRIAEKHFVKGDLMKSKKVLIHCLRYLELGSQVRENGNVTDYPAASSHRVMILDCPAETWSEMEECVQHVMDHLWTRITS